ncbi:anti-sigma factor [Streptomyces sp. NPDC014882]|uniref:anti-sigma factor n=1 Tax=Streptomyces sp. NPDC014882 TaxID=3364927 RepID=UPI0036F829E9
MEHTDDETLALIAIGEEPSPPAAEHLLACARCARELRALRHVVASARASSLDEHDLLQPPAGLWDSIAAELGIAVRHDRDTEAPPSPARPSRAAEEERTAEEGGLAEEGNAMGGEGVTGTATSRPPVWAAARERLRGPGRFAVALAACAALLGAAAGSTVTWWMTREEAAGVPSAASERLDSLRADSAGYARLSDGGGHRTLDITVEGLPRTSGYFEVWLMDRTHTKLVSMGVLGPDGRAALPVPDNIDLKEYSVVDVSVQPYNGSPDHSGDSVVRGPFAG